MTPSFKGRQSLVPVERKSQTTSWLERGGTEEEAHDMTARLESKIQRNMPLEQAPSGLVQVDGSLEVGGGLTGDLNVVFLHFAAQRASPGGKLSRLHDGFAQTRPPKRRQGAMGRPRDRIFQDRGLRGEEPGDKVAVLAGGSDDHATCAEVGAVEERAVDVKLFDVLLAGVDQHEIPGQVHLMNALLIIGSMRALK